jgi:hypothetical protein
LYTATSRRTIQLTELTLVQDHSAIQTCETAPKQRVYEARRQYGKRLFPLDIPDRPHQSCQLSAPNAANPHGALKEQDPRERPNPPDPDQRTGPDFLVDNSHQCIPTSSSLDARAYKPNSNSIVKCVRGLGQVLQTFITYTSPLYLPIVNALSPETMDGSRPLPYSERWIIERIFVDQEPWILFTIYVIAVFWLISVLLLLWPSSTTQYHLLLFVACLLALVHWYIITQNREPIIDHYFWAIWSLCFSSGLAQIWTRARDPLAWLFAASLVAVVCSILGLAILSAIYDNEYALELLPRGLGTLSPWVYLGAAYLVGGFRFTMNRRHPEDVDNKTDCICEDPSRTSLCDGRRHEHSRQPDEENIYSEADLISSPQTQGFWKSVGTWLHLSRKDTKRHSMTSANSATQASSQTSGNPMEHASQGLGAIAARIDATDPGATDFAADDAAAATRSWRHS